MTDYPAQSSRRRISSSSVNRTRKWSGVVAVLIFILLLFVIVGGFLGAIIPRGKSVRGTWDGNTGLAVAIKASPPAIVVYGKERARLGVYILPSDFKYATGEVEEPVRVIVSVFSKSGEEAADLLSSLSGVNVSRYVYFNNSPVLDEASIFALFKDFSSLKTPVALLFGKSLGIETTNLSKAELLRLWWEVKSLTPTQINLVDASGFGEEIIGIYDSKFKGIDRQSLNRELGRYFEGATRGDVQIVNNSGVVGAGALAEDMVKVYGWNVVSIESSPNVEKNCRVVLANTNSADGSLASLFGCNIIREQNAFGRSVFYLGSDFASRYF